MTNYELVNDDDQTRRKVSRAEAERLTVDLAGQTRGRSFLNDLDGGRRDGIQVEGGFLVREGTR